MTHRWFDDPQRDPRLADALRQTETPLTPAGDDALRALIVGAARQRLEGRRAAAGLPPWWSWLAAWARVALPAAMAAAAVAGVLVLRTPVATEESTGEAAGEAGVTDTTSTSAVLLGGTGAIGAVDYVLGTAARGWVLTYLHGTSADGAQ